MNEQAILDAYNLFVQNGYKKSVDEFKQLIASNPEALQDSYKLFVGQGYKKSIDDYKALMGLGAQAVQPVVTDKKKVATELPSAGGLLESATTPPKEEDYFTGAFGNVLRGFDNIVPLGIGDFVDDMARSVSTGYRQAQAAKEADKLLLKGTKASPEQLQKFINTQKQLASAAPSQEMQDYQKIYEQEGKGFWGVIKGLALNPTVIPEVITSSLTAMATNADALTAGAAAIGTGTLYGAGTGAAAGGVGAVPGAVAGAVASLPYAFGLASSVVEAGSTFGELLKEELGSKEMTKENVKAILEDPNKLQSIRNKAIARGLIIGTVDALTGKLATGVGAKTLEKAAAKSATGAVTKGAAVRATAAGAGVEALGGVTGEAAARAAIGQEMDVSEIALEGLAELPGGIRSTIQARLAKPSYEVNGEKVTSQDVDELINTMTPEQLAQTKFKIENDYEGRNFKIQDKIVTGQIKKEVTEANPNADEATIDRLVGLEKELNKFENNKTQSGRDKAAQIRSQIKTIQDAIQEQGPTEGVLRGQGPELGLQEVGERDQELEVVAAGSQETLTNEEQARKEELIKALENPNEEKGTVTIGEELIPIEDAQQQLALLEQKVQPEVSLKTRINVAPFFNTQIASVEEAQQLRQAPEYKQYVESLNELGRVLGVPVSMKEYIGGYKNEAGEEIVEISNYIELENATMEQTEEFAALAAALAPQVQEASIAAQYVNQGEKQHNANEYIVKVNNVNGALNALKEAGITDFSIDENTGEIAFIDVFDFTDPELQTKIGRFVQNLEDNNIIYEQADYRPVDSRRIGKAERKKVLGRVREKGTALGQGGQDVLQTLDQAVRRDAEFQGVNIEEYYKPSAGNRLFNKPLEVVSEIANGYYQRVFGKERPKYYGSKKLDTERAKRISDAFAAMKNDPTNPKVKEAYTQLAKETLDQYQAFLDGGFAVEINNNEPYANSQEMIDDLRNRKVIKIFSTESGFGDTPITEKQREENPLLRDSGFKDVNGQPMLVNDVFRAIHDFFGHAELGNSFGPKGEENAWNIHARMFSPLARAAMTTETRGQNSYVNFSGVNERIEELRDQARAFREEGKEEEAQKVVEQIYEEMSFADQKVGLLPEEFYQIDETDMGDADRIPVVSEDIMTADTKEPTTLEKVRDFLDRAEQQLDKFGKETAGMNIAVPVMKAIIKTVKALVNTGITLQEAIRRAAIENKVTEQDVIDSINALAEQRMQEAKPEGVSEMELPGYNRMIGELEGVIKKSEQRGVSEEKTMQNAIDYLQGSKVYQDASDTQRERMVRDVRKMFGKREKAAPKPEKLFGDAMDVTMITMSDYDLYKQQLKDQAKGAKNAKAVWMKTSQALTKYLKKMADGGYLTAKQTAAVLRKFSGVNMFDEKSIERFVDYMAKVFKNADYAEQIAQINSMLPTAKKNVQTKIGVSQTLTPLLNTLFAINPTLIPDDVFAKYAEVVTMMGERKTVLDLKESGKVTDTVEEILDAVNEEVSKSEELAEMFDAYENKVVDENGKIDFNETLKQMVKDETITEEEAAIMRKYKKNIMPMVQPEAKNEAEIAAEKEVLVGALKDAEVDADGLSMKDERNLARELAKLIKTDAVKGLDNTQLKNLLKVIDNINNGYLPHFAELMVERLDAINKSKGLDESVEGAKPLKFSSIYAKLKSLITKKDGFSELIRRNPLFYIDQVFGDFKTKNIFNSLFEAPADAQAQFQKSITELNNKLQEAEDAVAKSFKYDANKTLMSKFKMMTFMVQLEHDSNPDSRQVNPAAEYLKKTIEHIENGKSSFGKRDAEMLQQILDDYSDADGNIDNEKLYNSFNPAEKKAIKTIQDINNEMRDKAIYTAAVIRGDKIHPLNNYVHLNVLHEYKPDEAISGVAFVDDYNNSLRPSTKAKSLIARTGKVAPLNFDVFASANRGAKFTLMDYYLTKPIRTARKTINETSKTLKENKVSKEKRDIFNAIDRAFEEATENLLTTNFTSTSIGDDVVNFISKQGYRAVLASLPRFVGELSSNIAFAMIAAPKDFKAGVDYKGVVLSPNASTIMSNVGSKQTNRLFPHDTLSGKLIDTSIMNQASGVRGGRAQSDVANKIQQIYNLSVKKYQNVVEVMADALIATPDKMVMRPMWFGSFANEFKNLTGKDVDFDKLAANDEKYMAENKEAIDKARIVADEKTVLTGASDNAFMGILKGTSKPNQSAMLRGFNMFNNFMTRFLIYEYVTARTGINAAMGNGSISRKQGVALLGAVATRMTLYTVLTQVLSQGLANLFVDKEDEEDDKSLLQKIGQAVASSVTALLLGRDFGNATKSLVNYGIERVNEEYLDFLREGDYDPYKDALQYTIIPQDTQKKKTDAGDLIMNMMGPFGPAVKTTDLIVRKATEEPKKEAAAISRTEKEKQIRIPLEVLGNLGMIPLYKDVRKIVNTELYKDLDNAEKKSPMNKIGKEDMKKYFPQMYNEMYGPGGTLYDVELMKKEMRKEKEKMRKEMKDEMYKYTP